MAESEQKTVGNEPEPQHFSEEAPEQENSKLNKDEQEPSIVTDGSEKENSVVCESEKENINGDEPQNQIVNGNESEKKNSEDELEQNIPAVGAGQNDALNESEHGMLEKASDQDLAVKEQSEVGAENTHDEVKQETNSSVNSEGEKKWPGWPGESVFRMLVPAQKVGNIIGRKGESIKKIVEETRARIKILDGPPGTSERAVMVSAKEEPDAPVPPALDGLLRVHKRIVDGLEGDGTHPPPAAGGKVSTRMLVPATQAGILIGKQGATVKTVQEASNCIVRILSTDLPIFALQDDRVVEVVGEPAGVHKGVELIALHLRKFLVDRSIIQLFESQMQSPSTHMDHMPPQPSWGPSHGLPPSAGGDLGFGPTSQYMPPPRQFDNYYPSVDMLPPPQRPPHQGISAYGREPPMSNHASANPQPASTMISQVTQHMQIPLQYADTVIGTSGSTISYIRRSSGATVTIQESRGAPGEMTVEISGTASQVQAAQQLIQNSMAGAGAPTQTQAGGMADQAYNQGYGSYAATPGTTYGSPATSTGYASQPGSYGSVYGGHGGYGY